MKALFTIVMMLLFVTVIVVVVIFSSSCFVFVSATMESDNVFCKASRFGYDINESQQQKPAGKQKRILGQEKKTEIFFYRKI